MPAGDGTGPIGIGPTGRGLRGCVAPKSINPSYGAKQNYGQGYGRNYGVKANTNLTQPKQDTFVISKNAQNNQNINKK